MVATAHPVPDAAVDQVMQGLTPMLPGVRRRMRWSRHRQVCPLGGLTSYYAITYESSLPAALGVDLAQGLMDVCDQDFVLMSDWFAGTDFKFAVPTHIALNNASGGASWSAPAYPPPDGHHVTVQMNSVPNPADNNPPDPADTVNFVRFQVVAEVTEMFMYSKQNGWTGAGGDEGIKGRDCPGSCPVSSSPTVG